MLSRRNKVKSSLARPPSPPPLVTEILVVYPSPSSATTETGFELILDEAFSADHSQSDSEETEELTVKRQHDKRRTTPKANTPTSERPASPARTLPLTPTCTPSSLSTTESPIRSRTRYLLDEDEDEQKGGMTFAAQHLQKLVCMKKTAKEKEGNVKNEVDATPADTGTLKRRPLFRKLICQKYKPNLDEEQQSHLSRIPPSCNPAHQSMTPRELLSSSNANHIDTQKNVARWNTNNIPCRVFEEPADNPLQTPRIVQRLERTHRHHTQLTHELSSRHSVDTTSHPELQRAFESVQTEEKDGGRRTRVEINKEPQVSAPRQSSSPHRSPTAEASSAQSKTFRHTSGLRDQDLLGHNPFDSVWRNELSSPATRFLGGNAYQRRIERFQKEQNTRRISSSESFPGGGHADDESSFVEWVEQIENENNNTSQTSRQEFGFEYMFSPPGKVSQAPNTTTARHKILNNSMNTTADTSTYSSSRGNDDNHTPDTESQSSDEGDHLPQFKTIRQASFDGGSAVVSVGSIDSHQFGQTSLSFIDATPEAIMAAAMAGDLNDDDDDMWSGHISVKDEEFALAGVYSSPRVPF